MHLHVSAWFTTAELSASMEVRTRPLGMEGASGPMAAEGAGSGWGGPPTGSIAASAARHGAWGVGKVEGMAVAADEAAESPQVEEPAWWDMLHEVGVQARSALALV